MSSENNGALNINHEKTQIQGRNVIFVFSSRSCNIHSISLSVVIFDPSTPGVLFVDGSVEQNSLSTSTEVSILSTGAAIEELRIHFVGFSSLNARTNSGLSLSVSFSTSFKLKIDSTSLNSIKVTYLVISFVSCGTCTGYPYPYQNSCYTNCPSGTILSGGYCVPITCGNGYQLNDQHVCVPQCGANQHFTGKSCTCIQGYNLINGQCSQCPQGTYFNYIELRCEPLCGNNAQYNPQDGRCYCLNGFVLIGNSCGRCPSGSIYDQNQMRCISNTNCPQN